MDRRQFLAAVAASSAAAASPFAMAQDWPANPVRWVVPYPPGGGTDVLARTVAESMRKTLNQTIVVDNRPGASTNIGGQLVASAKPDGYTIMSADNASLPVIQSGKVRALAIGTAKRVPNLPNVPTLAELGLKDSEVYAFQGILGPKGLPPAIVQRLNADLQKAFKDPDVVKRMADFGMEALPGTPEQFHQLARTEAKRWGEVIKTAGVKLD